MDMYIRMYDEMKRNEGDNPTLGMNNLFQKEKIYGRGAFLLLPQSVPAPQNHCHLHVGVDNTVGIKLLRRYRFSGGEMTGKFRKVASHSAPEPAFGLFLQIKSQG